jgi:hypothetical protein
VVAAVWTLIGVVIAGGLTTLTLLRGEIRGLRSEMRTELGGLRGEMRTEIGGLRGEMHTELGQVRGDIAQVRSDITHLAEAVGHVQGTLDEHLRRHDVPARSA